MSNRLAKALSASSRRVSRRHPSARATKKDNKIVRELRALKAMKDAEIDTSEIPEMIEWRGAERGRFYRPVKRSGSTRSP
jgi:hypothetical protein